MDMLIISYFCPILFYFIPIIAAYTYTYTYMKV